VTELHHRQEDLQRSLSLLQATLESTTDGIVVVDLHDRITVYNRAFLELWRLSEPLLIERGYDWALQNVLDQLTCPEECVQRLREIREAPELESHDLLELKDGRVYERNSRPQRAEGRIIGRVFSYRDITEQVRAERSQRDLAERSRTLAECSHKLAGARLDPGATLAQAALTMSRLLGDGCVIRLASADRTRLEPVAYHHRDRQADELLGALLRGTSTRVGEGYIGRVALEGQTAFVPKAGLEFARAALLRQYWPYLDRYSIHSWIFVPMRAGDKILGVASVFRDLTPDSYKPEDLSFAEDLVSRIALAVENAELYDQAKKAVQLREEFLAVASHELKTPLTPLRVELQLLSQLFRSRLEHGSPLEGRLNTLLADSDQQIARLIRLVEDMLDATRLETGRLTLKFESVDLNRLVARVVEQLGSAQPRTAARLDFRPAPLPQGHWDRIRIEQVVTNLLTNALKFGEEKPVEIRVAPEADQIVLTVRDHGIGIPPKDQTKIFNRLERAVPIREYGGLGMGLYIARQIVEAHGGHISVESTPGGGSTFKVELPPGRAA
jgi:PAS domain S-box-containing protein